MKKVLALVTSLALTGAIYVTPIKDQKEQPNQKSVAKDTIQLRSVKDPGTGMG
ncbi:hypothetical protein [Streptococcus sobrinus]|uniref:hypothetical protein n=1 Tax=Streptococcus sobrinus TaxID=1310 RepID=UPI0002F5DAA5|nr:hypothetical protein [Streptococcus sobrinus]